MFPLALAVHGESKPMYLDMVDVMLQGKKGSVLQMPYGTFEIQRSFLSCDLKAAAMIYDCNPANTGKRFCPCGCDDIDKETYVGLMIIIYFYYLHRFLDPAHEFDTHPPELMQHLDYVVCILHLRIRLLGHVLDFVAREVSAICVKFDRDVMTRRLFAELLRCHVSPTLASAEEGKALKIYDPSGDVADNLCKYKFDLREIFRMCNDKSSIRDRSCNDYVHCSLITVCRRV